MFLVKSRDLYMKDEELYQIDVAFNVEDKNFDKGYYLVTSRINLLAEDNFDFSFEEKIKIQKEYSNAQIQLLYKQDYEDSETLENCLSMKESAINLLIEESKGFARESLEITDSCTANYSSNVVIKNPKQSLVAIEKMAREYYHKFEGLSFDEFDNSNDNDKKQDYNKKKDSNNNYFVPVDVSDFKFSDVAGLHEVKEELEQVVDYIKNPAKYKAMGAELQKGILLYGPPGTGKTLLAKALAGETNSKFFQISGSEFVEKYVGVGAKRVRELFKTAKKEAPSIIFIDEIDAIGSTRSSEKEGEHNKTLNQLLVELDGFNKTDDVVVLAATNRLDSLDNALTRAGRLGEHLYVGNPDFETRIELFEIHTSNKPIDPLIDLSLFAKKTHGFNGADIKSICNNAALFAIKEDSYIIYDKHFEKAFDKVVIGLHSKTKKMIDSEKKIVAYHEAGHALLNNLLSLDTVEKVSILPRGEALGLVYKLPNTDKYLYTKKQLEDNIKILLAGRVSEEIFFNEITNGASSDLEKASSIALNMAGKYGMFSNNSLLVVKESKISSGVKDRASLILEECYNECKTIIENNREVVETIASKLLEVEEINGEELNNLIEEYKVKSI